VASGERRGSRRGIAARFSFLVARCSLRSIVDLADFGVGVLFAPNLVPPAVQVVRNRARADRAKTVEFGDVFNSDGGGHVFRSEWRETRCEETQRNFLEASGEGVIRGFCRYSLLAAFLLFLRAWRLTHHSIVPVAISCSRKAPATSGSGTVPIPRGPVDSAVVSFRHF